MASAIPLCLPPLQALDTAEAMGRNVARRGFWGNFEDLSAMFSKATGGAEKEGIARAQNVQAWCRANPRAAVSPPHP